MADTNKRTQMNTVSQTAKDRHNVVAAALESARVEVVRRMAEYGYPLSLQIRELEIIPNENGWQSQWVTVSISGLRNPAAEMAIEDDSVPNRIMGLRPQLETFAQLLDQTTDLGIRPANFLPGLTGVDAILARYLTNFAHEYLGNLHNLAQPDQALVERLAGELDELIDNSIHHTNQLAIDGVKVGSPLEYRGVKLRQLSPTERGNYWQSRNDDQLNPYRQHTDFVIPREFSTITPSALLEVTTTRVLNEPFDQSTLINRVALAFYLKGFDITGTGIVVGFDHPRWATIGQSHAPSLVDEKHVATSKPITETDLQAIVDLAYKMPEFGPSEASNHEIALYRTLRGLGMHWQESGFLDFAIALEAALLQGVETELSYRFALYGALFLQDERSPEETFTQLRDVYTIRSKLVHGSKVDATKREQAIKDARDIVKAIILKAIENGWPDPRQLNRRALVR
jgi:hypothetical protein